MRIGCLLVIVFSLVLAINFGSEAKQKVQPKVKAEAAQVNVSGVITEVSYGQDTTLANRTIVFSVKDNYGKIHSCKVDNDHLAKADWDYLKNIIVKGQPFCFSGMPDQSKKCLFLVNIKTCKD